MFISETVAVVVLPALSVAVPVTLCPVPSVVSIVSPRQVAIPDVASSQVKSTVTSVLFHPFVFAGGVYVYF